MSKIKKSCLFRIISLVLILTFISLDISYAYLPEHNVGNSTLATPSVLQQTPINDQAARFQQSVFSQSALIASVYDIGEYFFGNADKGVEPFPSKYAEDAMRADLGKHLSDADTEILNIVPVEYIKKTAPDKLKAALDEIGFKETLPDEGVVFILYKKGDKKFLVQVARKYQVSPDSLPGYEWVTSDKYVVKYMPEYYKGPATQVAPVQKNMEGFQLIHRGTPDDPLRIVLIMPRSILQKVKPTRFPIGLMSIASCLRNKDFLFKLSNEIPDLKFENKGDIPNIDVRIIDLQAETEDFDLEAELKRIGPDIVGISAVTQLFSAAGNVSKIAAKAVPQAIRVIGGVHISAIGERISNEFENAMADYGFQIAVIREGEEALSEVVLRLASYRDIRDVPGIVIRESETTTLYRITDRRDVKRHLRLNDYPISAHALDLINRTGYEELVDVHGRNRGIAGGIITSRGCPYSCIFCASKAVFSRRAEHVSAEKIFEELKYYYDRGYVGFYIMDDNLCTDPKKIKKLAGLVEQSDIDVTFSAFAHANSITPDVARDLKRSGCAVIALGVESGDEGLLEKIGKKTSIKKIDEATKSLQAVGIYVKFFLLVGLPGQDWLSIKKTAEIILKDRPNAIDVAVTTPYPGSALYEGNGIKVVDGVSQDQLVHIAEPQLKAKAAVDVLTYTDVMFSEEIARARDLLNTLFRNIDNKNTVDVVMREIDERIAASSIINNALIDEPLTPQATQLFDLVESSLNNERAKYVEAGNKIAGGLDKNMTTAEIKERVQKVIEAIEKLDQKDVSPEVRTNIEMLKSNLSQFEADGGMASLTILARRAKRENQKLIIGLETDWMPAMNIKGSLYRNAIAVLMKEIGSIGDALKSMGLDNVEIIRGTADSLADSLTKKAKESNTDMRNIIVMASKNTINSDRFKVFRDANEKNRPFLTGIDPTELIKLYTQFGEAVSKQLYIRLASLLYMTLELAAGKEPPQSPMIVSYDKKMRILILLPKADPIDYETLKNNYAAEKAALHAA